MDKITLSDIPIDPLSMPPPYWRSSGSIFQIQDSLDDITNLLYDLISVNDHTNSDLEVYYSNFHDEEDDSELEKFSEIVDDLLMLEHKIKLKSEIAILMSAIQTEDRINEFCVYNLHKGISESIEKLSPPEKLVVASTSVGKYDVKSNSVYESIKKLSAWRNAYTHGHCVDRPVKSLRHNHLISPTQYPTVPKTIHNVLDLVSCFINVEEYLRQISINSYTSLISVEVKEIKEYLSKLSGFRFHLSDESGEIYTLEQA